MLFSLKAISLLVKNSLNVLRLWYACGFCVDGVVLSLNTSVHNFLNVVCVSYVERMCGSCVDVVGYFH